MRVDDDRANGWLDERLDVRHTGADAPERKEDREEGRSAEAFLSLIREITGPDCPNVSVVLLCRSPEPEARDTDGLLQLLRDEGSRPQSGFPMDSWIILSSSCFEFSPSTTPREAVLWCATTGIDDRTKARRRRFLQAMVLMQRTRFLANVWHPSFDIGDAEGREFSAEEVRHWTEQLEVRHVVRRKTGGFLLMHTPIRESIRFLLDHPPTELGRRKQIDGPFGKIAIDAKVQHALQSWNAPQQKPVVHRCLADWYKRVFLASHSPAAAFEAIYHACESTRAALHVGKTGSEILEPLAFTDALLREAANIIRVRGFSRGSCRQLKRIFEDLDDLRQRWEKQRVRSDDAVGEVIFQLQKRCLIIMRGIALEVSEITKAYERHVAIRRLVIDDRAAGSSRSSSHSVSERLAFQEWASQERKDHVSPRGSRRSSTALRPSSVGSDGEERLVLWVRWWRWLGRLGRASRSYKKAEHSLLRVLYAVGRRADPPSRRNYGLITTGQPNGAGRLIRDVKARLFDDPGVFHGTVADPNLLRLEVLKALEEYLQLLLVAAHVRSQIPDGDPRPLLDLTCDIAQVAEGILDRLSTAREAGSKVWGAKLRTRRIYLQTHRSIALARQKEFVPAARLLTAAECELVQIDAARRSPAAAIIALHRAELELERGYASFGEFVGEDVKPPDKLGFREYWTVLRQLTDGEVVLPGQSPANTNRLDGNMSVPGNVRRLADWVREWRWSNATASLQNASTALDDAYPVLFSRRKNVWWATWYFQRRLRVMELQLWVSLGAEGQPIPFLGLEFAPRRTSTAADQMLDDTLRMVRVDSYRLATVIDAYAGCLWALHLRLAIDRCAVPMPHRQRDMNLRLKDALERLERISKLRARSGKRENPDGVSVGRYAASNAVDDEVVAYTRSVARYAGQVAALTRRD